MIKKVKTMISTTEDMKKRLKRQARENGMDVSSYIQHLIIMQEKTKENNARMELILNKTMPNGFQDLVKLAHLIQKKGE
mgnify:CR=1 FL=1